MTDEELIDVARIDDPSKDKVAPQQSGSQEYYCIRCAKPVTTKILTGVSKEVVANRVQVTSPPVCSTCDAVVVKYTRNELARLLAVQMSLLEEGKRIDEMARTLRRQLDEKNRQIEEMNTRCWHPETGRIINRSETTFAGVVGRVRIGWQGRVFDLTDAGLAEGVAYLKQLDGRALLESELQSLRTVVENLRKENAELRARVDRAGGGSSASRWRRSVEI